MKKTSIILVVVFALGSLPFTSCKKGEEDPGISFRSRAGRLAGEWLVSSYDESTTSTDSDKDGSKQVTISVEGESYTKKVTPYGEEPKTETTNGIVNEYAYSFTKEGKYTATMDITIEQNKKDPFSGEEYTLTTQTITEIEGTWDFLNSRSEEYKNKERVVLNKTGEQVTVKSTDSRDNDVTNDIYTYSYSQGESSQTWHLTKLSNKEIIADWIIDNSTTLNPDGFSSVTEETSGDVKIVLTQK